MNKLALTAAAFGTLAFSLSASAGELADLCVATVEENGFSEGFTSSDLPASCQCLEDAVSGNEALTAELFASADTSDADERQSGFSQEAADAVTGCFEPA